MKKNSNALLQLLKGPFLAIFENRFENNRAEDISVKIIDDVQEHQRIADEATSGNLVFDYIPYQVAKQAAAVATETGLTPSEIAEQRKYLFAALAQAVGHLREFVPDVQAEFCNACDTLLTNVGLSSEHLSAAVKAAILKNATPKIKLLVIDEHTLAYSDPERSFQAQVLRASVLMGSHHRDGDVVPLRFVKKIRLATEKDFDKFMVSFDGYKNSGDYEYAQEEEVVVVKS